MFIACIPTFSFMHSREVTKEKAREVLRDRNLLVNDLQEVYDIARSVVHPSSDQ
jgi:hypothetical protein